MGRVYMVHMFSSAPYFASLLSFHSFTWGSLGRESGSARDSKVLFKRAKLQPLPYVPHPSHGEDSLNLFFPVCYQDPR